MRIAVALVLVVGLNAPQAVWAQAFADDVESGTVLKTDNPAGAWDGEFARGSNAWTAMAGAAHRGGYGLRFSDVTSGTTPDSEGAVYADFAQTAADYHLRYWFRVASTNAQGNFIVALVRANDTQSSDLANVFLDTANGNDVGFGGRNDSRTWLGEPSFPSTQFATGAWHLVEMSVNGVGTANGRRRLWIDGVLKADMTGIDWSAWAAASFIVGPIWSDGPQYQGTLEFDDVRGGTAEHASTLVVNAPAQVQAGQCVAVTVSLRSSAGNARPAPYAFAAAVSAQGAALYADASCATATTTAAFASGAATASVWLRASAAGTATVSAAYGDFLGGQGSVPVTEAPDAGMEADGGVQSDAGMEVDAGVEWPTAVIQPDDVTVEAGAGVELDGSGSRAPAGAELAAWRWALVAGPAYIPFTVGEPSVAFTPVEPGEYVFELVVTDSLGRESEPARATVTVAGEVFHPPSALGCGCGASGSAAFASLLAWGLLLAASRRRLD